MVNIRGFDLNLLPVLRALLEYRSVSSAADSLGLSQPAVSNALSRLRGHYGDPLFHRTGGRMEPTARAVEVGFSIVDALARIESTLERGFNPRSLSKTFKVALVSYSGFLFLPALIEKLCFEAPNVQVKPEHMDELTAYRALSNLELDFAMGIFWEKSPMFSRLPLLETSFKVITRPGHPLSKMLATTENLASYKHIRLPVLDNVDRILDAHGLSREFGATSVNPFTVPFMVSQSDMIVILPSRLIMSFATICPLHEMPLAFSLPRCESNWFGTRSTWTRRRFNGSPKRCAAERCQRIAPQVLRPIRCRLSHRPLRQRGCYRCRHGRL